MKIVFLDASTMGETIDLAPLRQYGELTVFAATTPAQTRGRIADADIVITNKVVIDRLLMDAAPRLRLICVAATGMNNIDLDYAAQKNIAVKNVKGYSTDSVAQLTFASLFYLLNKVRYYDDYVKSGAYVKSEIFTHLGREFWQLSGKRFGIIGLGTIGRKVAQIAAAFGCEVVYFSTSGANDNPDYRRVELDELLCTCDLISIHAALTERSKNLVDYDQLVQMKPHALIINMGRGGIVNEKGLAQALNEGKIGGAALDVLEKEPMQADHPLLSVVAPERLLITPHIAWAGIEARQTLLDGICRNIEETLDMRS